MSPSIEKNNIRLEYRPRGRCIAEVNPILEEVFVNLLSNAVKYSPRGSRVVVDFEKGGDHWKVRVSDNGVGVPDSYKETIFERFERGERGGVAGTGLGLAIVKRIMELHRGRVWVEDNTIEYCDDKGRTRRKKQGSIFYVTIPKNLKAR